MNPRRRRFKRMRRQRRACRWDGHVLSLDRARCLRCGTAARYGCRLLRHPYVLLRGVAPGYLEPTA